VAGAGREPPPDRPQLATTDEAIRAVSRLLTAASDAQGTPSLERALVREARAFTGASSALLLGAGESGVLTVAAGDPNPVEFRTFEIDGLTTVREALDDQTPRRLEGAEAARLAAAAGLPPGAASALLLLPARPAVGRDSYLLLLADGHGDGFSPEDVEAGAVFATAATASLGQLTLVERHAAQVARQSSLARAAKALNESLDLSRVLPRICREAAEILDADTAGVYRGSAAGGLVLEATTSSPDLVGSHVEPGAGIAGRAIALGRPIMSRGDEGVAGAAPATRGRTVHSALAAPMRWDGELRGVLYVGWYAPRDLGEDELALLESFAELAAIACRNASVHAGLAEAARTDGLTGCLNHAALHETLRREMLRSRRTGRRISVAIIDLDHFKDVNEDHGHLIGDEVLRRVGRALREAVRPYDFVARYGGDEFAIVAVDAGEARAAEIAERAIARLGRAIEDVLGSSSATRATAGVAEWAGTSSSADLVRDADRALLYGKQQGVRGAAVRATGVPHDFVLGRPSEEVRRPDTGAALGWPSAVRRETEPLRRRAAQLAMATELGARVGGMTGIREIAEAAVTAVDGAFDLTACAVIHARDDGALETVAASGPHGAAARASAAVELALANRRPEAAAGGSEALLAVPIRAGDETWGALDVRRRGAAPFEGADVRFLEVVAGQLASALRSAGLYERLERAYLDTSAALAEAIEAKDSRPARHARAIADLAESLGRHLGMDADELGALRYAALFHDIGKIAVPEAVLNKAGPLTDSERAAIERHAVVADEILARVEFLAAARPLVRHSHERWDGRGYPDGLAGERIPSGARVLTVCDAHQAMTADRPYRSALTPDAVRSELTQGAGTQFDARVVAALLDLVAA
jgi:diguanylate cyclase (GGDEF)-like protein